MKISAPVAIQFWKLTVFDPAYTTGLVLKHMGFNCKYLGLKKSTGKKLFSYNKIIDSLDCGELRFAKNLKGVRYQVDSVGGGG